MKASMIVGGNRAKSARVLGQCAVLRQDLETHTQRKKIARLKLTRNLHVINDWLFKN